jgi:hypothetical protein
LAFALTRTQAEPTKEETLAPAGVAVANEKAAPKRYVRVARALTPLDEKVVLPMASAAGAIPEVPIAFGVAMDDEGDEAGERCAIGEGEEAPWDGDGDGIALRVWQDVVQLVLVVTQRVSPFLIGCTCASVLGIIEY